jgi:hypothetical protein
MVCTCLNYRVFETPLSWVLQVPWVSAAIKVYEGLDVVRALSSLGRECGGQITMSQLLMPTVQYLAGVRFRRGQRNVSGSSEATSYKHLTPEDYAQSNSKHPKMGVRYVSFPWYGV